eukprot:TRINITY_DN30173_c0_g2_i2.p1 TRINITY_DN30173_c0_g2~~TRINITY_DN30173_c0_g2_i2.p1  ORF type:complete len:226 (+),score=24.49 TRINITY_DN30173_c0_g2_i2:73-750(+)
MKLYFPASIIACGCVAFGQDIDLSNALGQDVECTEDGACGLNALQVKAEQMAERVSDEAVANQTTQSSCCCRCGDNPDTYCSPSSGRCYSQDHHSIKSYYEWCYHSSYGCGSSSGSSSGAPSGWGSSSGASSGASSGWGSSSGASSGAPSGWGSSSGASSGWGSSSGASSGASSGSLCSQIFLKDYGSYYATSQGQCFFSHHVICENVYGKVYHCDNSCTCNAQR